MFFASIRMRQFSRIIFASVLAAALVACGQAPSEPEADAAAPAEPAVDSGGGQQTLASVDADGNVAPFGYASKQPVPVEPAPGAMAAVESAESVSGELFGVHCAACHGADAKGVQGLGLNLVESTLVGDSSQAELIAFLKAGRSLDSPDNVSGVPMPAFAWMTDDELNEITAYVQGLHSN